MNIAEGELTSIAICWVAERADGAGIALTSHDLPVVREGITYEPSQGLTPGSVTKASGTDAEDSEIEGAIGGEGLTELDLDLGRWDGASVLLAALDWETPEKTPIELLSGELGEVSVENGRFSAELRGAASKLARPVCPKTSPECRAELGDKACRVDLGSRSIRARVFGNAGRELTFETAVDERFRMGRLRYLLGENCGIITTILAVEGNAVRVSDAPRGVLEPGCLVELREGCDKRLETCSARFANAENFRGEPHLSGTDLLTRYPGS